MRSDWKMDRQSSHYSFTWCTFGKDGKPALLKFEIEGQKDIQRGARAGKTPHIRNLIAISGASSFRALDLPPPFIPGTCQCLMANRTVLPRIQLRAVKSAESHFTD